MGRFAGRVALVVALLAAASLVAQLGRDGPTRGIEAPTQMERIILASVPVGSPITEARRFMESEGFRCQEYVNSPCARGDEVREGLDFLHCDRSDGGWIVQRRWQVALVHRDGRVTEVLASTGLVGP
jgi:hypothetical protein